MTKTASTNISSKKRNTRSHKFDNLIGPTDASIDLQARDVLITARIALVMKHPFFGNLATRLRLVNADDWLATAATDGICLYYNSRFIKMLRPKEVQFLVAHEIMHLVYDHLGRRGDRDPQIWNVAGDYTINADLKRHKVGEFVTSVPCLYEAKYDGKSADEIYEDLVNNSQKINIDSLVGQLLDDHMDGADSEDGEGDDKKSSGRPKMSPEERERIRQEIKQAVISAAQVAGANNLPAGVERLIDRITNPTINWRELIETNLTSAIRSDFSWMRISRRGWDMEAIMPGMNPEPAINIHVAIDMSGSISLKQAQSFLGEIAGMTEQFPHFVIHVVSFDTQVYNPQVFRSENLDDIRNYKPMGGGGTDFNCVYDHLKSEDSIPHRLVFFTDGYPFGSWGDENFCDVTYIIHGSNTIKPPFGQYAYLDSKDLD